MRNYILVGIWVWTVLTLLRALDYVYQNKGSLTVSDLFAALVYVPICLGLLIFPFLYKERLRQQFPLLQSLTGGKGVLAWIAVFAFINILAAIVGLATGALEFPHITY